MEFNLRGLLFAFALLLTVAIVTPVLAQVEDGLVTGQITNPLTDAPAGRPSGVGFISFDDTAAPCGFPQQCALRDAYAHLGVTFRGPSEISGAAVIDSCGNFHVSEFSPPNFLGTNCIAELCGTFGVPTGPETILFATPIESFSCLVGSYDDRGRVLSVEAFDVDGFSLSKAEPILQPQLQLVTLTAPGIMYVVVGQQQPCVWVLDDLSFDFGPTPVQSITWSTVKCRFK